LFTEKKLMVDPAGGVEVLKKRNPGGGPPTTETK
jgi:hypothetical protein